MAKWMRGGLHWLVVGVVGFGVVSAYAAEKKASSSKKEKPAKQVEAKEAAEADKLGDEPKPLNPITRQAQEGGVKRCLDRMEQLTSFVAGGNPSAAVVSVSPKTPDSMIASAAMEVQLPQAVVYSSVSVAPRWNGCSGQYEGVAYWQNNCAEVASKGFSQLKPVGVVQKAIQVLQGPGTMQVFLMSAGTGCVSIKKEVLY